MTGGGGGAFKCSHVGRFVSFLDLLDNEIPSCLCGAVYSTSTRNGNRTRDGAAPVQSLNILPIIPLRYTFRPVDTFSISCHYIGNWSAHVSVGP